MTTLLPQILLMLFSVLFGIGAGYQWQENVYERKISDIKEAHNAQAQAAKKAFDAHETSLRNRYEEALRKSNTRLSVLVRDSASSRNAVNRLSEQADSNLRAASESLHACHATATTFRVVFGECTERYETLGRDAQGHVIDKQALIESFPITGTNHE